MLFRTEIYEGMDQSSYDIDRLCSVLKEELGESLDEKELKGLDFKGLRENIIHHLEAVFEEKMSVVDPVQRMEIERILYLQVLDNAWRAHLYQMDILKTGIGLRGYNQKDPLTEYKKESYNLFIELVEQIKFESFKTLHVVQLRGNKEEEERRAMEVMIRRMEEANAGATLHHASSNEDEEAEKEKRTARNEPCPCGSGKKYKQCCGKSGPKKGILA
jgi:preprotein translocase subunit SecA